MSPEQKSLVQETWRQVVPIADVAASLLYGRLFQIDPSTRDLFAGVDLGEPAGRPYHSARLRQRCHANRARTPRPRKGSGGSRVGPETDWTSAIRPDSEPTANSASNLPEIVPRGTPTPE